MFMTLILSVASSVIITACIMSLGWRAKVAHARDKGFEEGYDTCRDTTESIPVFEDLTVVDEPFAAVPAFPAAEEAQEQVDIMCERMDEDCAQFIAGLRTQRIGAYASTYVLRNEDITATGPIPVIVARETVRELIVQQ